MSEQTPTPPPPFSFPDLPFSPINSNPDQNPNPSSSLYTLPPFPAKRKRTGFHRKASNPSFSPQFGESSNPRPNPSTSVSADLADEIIVINKEATTEAVTALSAGFPADSLTDEEIEAGVVSDVGGIEQVNYILIRNHIFSRWRENVTNWVQKEAFTSLIPPHCEPLLNSAYNYLVSHGYVNFGVAPAIKEKIPAEPAKANVIIVGAGLAGLAAARLFLESDLLPVI